MNNKSDIVLNNTFDRIIGIIGFVGLLFLLIHYLHLDTFSIDAWIEAFMKATLLAWLKILLYSGLTIFVAFLLFRTPYEVILTEKEIQLHKMFAGPQTVNWEDITKFEIIEDKRYKSKISLLIISDQFSTEVWPSQRPGFQVFEHSATRDKMLSLAKRKMIQELADDDKG
jgi:hypothetical protein